MTPEEIVERAAEVLAEHVWQAALGGCTPTCGWHGPEDETEQAAHARHQVDVLDAAGLLPTGEVTYSATGEDEDGGWVAVLDEPTRAAAEAFVERRGGFVTVRYSTPWTEVTP